MYISNTSLNESNANCSETLPRTRSGDDTCVNPDYKIRMQDSSVRPREEARRHRARARAREESIFNDRPSLSRGLSSSSASPSPMFDLSPAVESAKEFYDALGILKISLGIPEASHPPEVALRPSASNTRPPKMARKERLKRN